MRNTTFYDCFIEEHVLRRKIGCGDKNSKYLALASHVMAEGVTSVFNMVISPSSASLSSSSSSITVLSLPFAPGSRSRDRM